MRKEKKVTDETLDAASVALGARLNRLLNGVKGDPVAMLSDETLRIDTPRPPAQLCSFCGGAGEVETEIEDFMGSTVIVTIACPHPPKEISD